MCLYTIEIRAKGKKLAEYKMKDVSTLWKFG